MHTVQFALGVILAVFGVWRIVGALRARTVADAFADSAIGVVVLLCGLSMMITRQ